MAQNGGSKSTSSVTKVPKDPKTQPLGLTPPKQHERTKNKLKNIDLQLKMQRY